ncbi:MAG: hypothetical protein ACYDA8_05995, partial [Deferrisomatales bacterium]
MESSVSRAPTAVVATPATPSPTAVKPSATSSDFDTTLNPFGLLPATREPPLSSLTEWIVGVRLLGPADEVLRTVDDLEVLVRAPGQRLWPLLRFLASIGEEVQVLESDDQGPLRFTFFAADARKVEVSVPSGELRFGLEVRSGEFVRRRSEFTRAPEVYVPEALVAEVLGYEIGWNELAVEIVARADSYPQWYIEKQRSRRASWGSIKEVPPNLPETRPPAEPRDWSLDFVEVSLSGGSQAFRDLEERQSQINRPGERLWGRAGGGLYRLDLSQKGWVSDGRAAQGADFMVYRAGWLREK